MSGASEVTAGEASEPAIRLLLVDDDIDVAQAMVRLLERRGCAITVFHDPELGLAYLADHLDDFEVILLDVGMPRLGGLAMLERVKQLECVSPVVMWTADARALTATAAMRAGAFSYTTKPVARLDEFLALLYSAASYCHLKRHTRALEQRVALATPPPGLVGASRTMRALQARIAKLARSDISILILGESGTGKELVARSIHQLSARDRRPFVAVNCGSLPESMIDSELFGHARGAFTGAVGARAGVFVEADGGTLFLDEIGEMPLAVQARLLRVLQEREVRPLGAEGVRRVDVRVVAATHVDLHRFVADKRFREDLYYRLNVATIEVPPLRSRMEDVPVLAAHLLRKHAGSRAAHVSPSALDALMSYAWPGNVRELENALLHALALTASDTIDASALPARVTSRSLSPRTEPRLPEDLEWAAELSLGEAKKRAVDEFERRYVSRALERASGNLTEAARAAGLDRSNFRRVLTRLGIHADQFRDD